MMSAKKVGIFAIIANKQGSKLVNPGKTALTAEPLLIDRCIEKAFTPAFDGFPVALVLADVGNDVVIEADFARFQGIKGTVGVEVSSGNRQAQVLHMLEGGLQMRFEVESIVMIACDDPRRSHYLPLRVGDGKDIGGFGTFSVLVGDTFAAFLRQRMATIEVQVS